MAMQIEFIRKLPSPQELMEQFPIDDRIRSIKAQRDETIRRILTGEDDRFLLIIGPCSADNEDAVVDYAHRLAAVQEKVADTIFIIPRVYTNKPRTIGVGYKGMLHQPDPEGKEDMLAGIIAIREMTPASSAKRDSPARKKSSTRKSTATCRTSCPTPPSEPAPSKTSSTA